MKNLMIFNLLLISLGVNGAEQLTLVAETKVSKILDKGYEPSGVVTRGQFYYVIFDDHPAIAEFNNQLSTDLDNRMIGETSGIGYEGITYDEEKELFFTVIEAVPEGDRYIAKIVSYDRGLNIQSTKPVQGITFDNDSKGFEGIARVSKHGESYILLLCEGNKCKKGKKSGNGKIWVFHNRNDRWEPVDKIRLPRKADFKDYSGLDVKGKSIVVTSQEDSKLWIGKLQSRGHSPATINFWIQGKGEVYEFNEDENRYCNIEGVSILNDSTFVVVSDKKKKKQPESCKKKDQSIHVFTLKGN